MSKFRSVVLLLLSALATVGVAAPPHGSHPTDTFQKTRPGKAIKNGIKLRILCVGDSITAGFGDTDGNGYRQQLRKDLSKNKVVWAGTQLNENSGMADGYHAGFPGKTIKYITNHVGPSLKQQPNIILLAAGTNDMNSNTSTIAKDGNDPREAAGRLGNLIDKITEECPDAVVLVSIIINACDSHHAQRERTKQYQKLIPGIFRQRRQKGKHVVAVDFSRWEEAGHDLLRDCVHPTDDAYDLMGDWWYSFITKVDGAWIQGPRGKDPDRDKK
ncbi:SGNH-hydro domain-containing protein [Fusarium sp. LHS14.1]|nr:SGNH-hydro domain-containing protein [Fusarium sp. LHS14.1]